MVFLKSTSNSSVYSRASGFGVHNPHAKNRYQNERTAKMLQLQRWCLAGACELTQPPTEAVQGPWPGLAAPGPCLSCAATSATSPAWELSSSCGELALAGSHTSVQLLHPPAGQERKQEERSKKLIGQNIDGEITYQVLLGAKQTQLREFNLLFWGKSWQTLTYLSSKFPRVSSLQAPLCSLVTTASASQSLQGGRA